MQIVSAFPFPPSHYKLFEDEQVLSQIKPPSIPTTDFLIFGVPQKIESFDQYENPTLESFGCVNLTTSNDSIEARLSNIKELVNLSFRLFSQLVDKVMFSPEQINETLSHIHMTMTNIHYQINDLRSYQAKQDLKKAILNEIESQEAFIKEIEQLLEGYAESDN